MYTELTAGYHVDPERLINGAIFDVAYSEMVVVKDIPFYSLCEHHLLPFFGTAAVAYIPRGPGHRAVEDPARRRDVRAPAPGPGAADPADRRLPAGAARRRRASASSSRRPTCARSCAASASPGTIMTTSSVLGPVPDPRPDARRVLRPPRPAGAGGVARAVALEVPIPLTARLAARVAADHAEPDRAMIIAALERVDLGDWLATRPPAGRERVLAAILVLMRGDPGRLARSIGIAERDWRNALVWAELGQPDWPARLDELLGPG